MALFFNSQDQININVNLLSCQSNKLAQLVHKFIGFDFTSFAFFHGIIEKNVNLKIVIIRISSGIPSPASLISIQSKTKTQKLQTNFTFDMMGNL